MGVNIMGKFSVSTRGRAWVATVQIQNMENAGLSKEEYENPEKLADFFTKLWNESGKDRTSGIAVCLSAKGLYHAHMACYGNTTTLKKVSDTLFQSHVEPQLGGKKELTAYLKKEGMYEEKGEIILFTKDIDMVQDAQGARNDIEEIEEMLNKGMKPAEILGTSFSFWKYEKMIKSAYFDKRIKETPLIKNMWNEYHWGASGTGKTYVYIEKCKQLSADEVYLCNDYANSRSSGGGFDFYSNNPAKVIILDEFRGNMDYKQLLSLLDVYSRNQQHCRYQNIYQLWESVIICSIYPIEEVYGFMVDQNKQGRDPIKQLYRRIHTIVYHYKNKRGEYRKFQMPMQKYPGKDDMIKKAEAHEAYIEDLRTKYGEEQYCDELYKAIEKGIPDLIPEALIDLTHMVLSKGTIPPIEKEPFDFG